MDGKIKIPIKNIYYMLCYAWDIIDYADASVCGTEDFDNIFNLLGRILVKETGTLIKRGFHKEYVDKEDELSTIRGQIDMSATVSQMTMVRKRLLCRFDEYSDDVLFNKILKSTMVDILRYDDLEKGLARQIRSMIATFSDIEYIEVTKRHFSLLRYNRNNIRYEIIINVCKLFRLGLIVNQKGYDITFADFVDEKQMNKVYEHFILNYYERTLDKHGYHVYAPKLKWDIDDADDSLFPEMQTDIVVENKKDNWQLIIDAKYYPIALVSKFADSAKKIRSGHVNQIFAYMSMSKFSGKISGMLLYPTTYMEVDETKTIAGKYITSFKTLNLNEEWTKIEERLKSFIA